MAARALLVLLVVASIQALGEQLHNSPSADVEAPAPAADDACSAGTAPPRSGDFAAAAPPPEGWARLIVRFDSYQHADSHRDRLLRAPPPPAAPQWRWVERHNPAMRYPTDFGLVDAPEAAVPGVRAWLAALDGVRDSHFDRAVRHPLATPSRRARVREHLEFEPSRENADRVGAARTDAVFAAAAAAGAQTFAQPGGGGFGGHVGPLHGHVAADGTVTKRPGRLQTRFSEGLLEGAPGREAAARDAAAADSHAAIVRDRLAALAARHGVAWHPLHSNDTAAAAARRLLEVDAQHGAGGAGEAGYPGLDNAVRELEGLWGGGGLGTRGGTEWRSASQRARRSLAWATQVTVAHEAEAIWSKGFTGKGVKVGVFDTGLRETHPHIRNLEERSNWTHENTLSDELGHGTFVAGVIGGHDRECPGFAPDVLIHTFKVFTNDQVSFTSWFLDAFNYALAKKMDVVNLSIGGPDFLDHPFVDKVLEITANGMIMVSAIGNDGPVYGTLNNPADQLDVIGVGGIDYSDAIASFSSRGMSTWELPLGFGRSKPDVMAYGREVKGSKIGGGCRSLSGTSVASPVVAGAVTLLFSTVPDDRRHVLNPASMKQALMEGATRLPALNLFEQGQGKLNLPKSMAILQSYTPRASIVPAVLDLTDCPYMWPFCMQPLYARAQPLIFNATILNGMGVWGELAAPPRWVPSNAGGRLLDIVFEHSAALWPWSGHLSLFITVRPEGERFSGAAGGTVHFTVRSPGGPGEAAERTSDVTMTVRATIIPTPPRAKRLLWDQFHSIKYPPAYIPRDNLGVRSDILDWHGDHLATNYHTMYTYLRGQGVFVETLGSPLTCFDASQYGALLIADSEEEFYPEEVAKLAQDVKERGLGLLLFPEWYNVAAMSRMRFFDDNTRSWWDPVTGGGNIPALNDLVAPLGLAFGDAVLQGDISIGEHRLQYASGTHVVAAPAGARTISAAMQDRSTSDQPSLKTSPVENYHILALVDAGRGRVAAYGDANCIDSSHATSNCFKLLHELFQHVTQAPGGPPGPSASWAGALTTHAAPVGPPATLPQRQNPDTLLPHSFVRNTPLQCYLNSALEFGRRLQAVRSEQSARDRTAADDAARGAGGAGPAALGGSSDAVAAAARSKIGALDRSAKAAGGDVSVTAQRFGGLPVRLGGQFDSSPRHSMPHFSHGTQRVFGILVLGVVAMIWLFLRKRRMRDKSAPPKETPVTWSAGHSVRVLSKRR